MEIPGDSLDEILIGSYEAIRRDGAHNKGSRGDSIELLGVTLRLKYPRARLSRSADRGLPFSALGEFLWYLTKSDDPEFITAYIPAYTEEISSDGTIKGAYGPRLFSIFQIDQVEAVCRLLNKKPSTRRAVLQIYAASDLLIDKEVPCTTTLQFFNRDGRLHLQASLRSNDAYLGLPHDVFCFTMLQEMVARRLKLEIGEYIQTVGSFHLYLKHADGVDRYLKEGHHRLNEMPIMPAGDPFLLVPALLGLEARVRSGEAIDPAFTGLDDYWADLLRLVQARFTEDADRLVEICDAVKHPLYRMYIEDRIEKQRRVQ